MKKKIQTKEVILTKTQLSRGDMLRPTNLRK